METNTKQLLKRQLFDLEVLQQTEKGLAKNNLPLIYSKWQRSIWPVFPAPIPSLVSYDLYASIYSVKKSDYP